MSDMKAFSLLQLLKEPTNAIAVRLRLLRLLYANLKSSLIVVLFNATLFTYILWPILDHAALGIWYALLMSITLLRYVDTRSFFRQQKHEYGFWYRRLLLGVLLSAVLWGAVPLLFFPQDAPGYQLFIIVIIVGMSSGALNTLAADLRLSLIYLFGLLVPLAYRLLEQGSEIYIATAVLTAVFIFIVSHAARQFHQSLLKGYNNLELYRLAKEQLGSSEKRLRIMFDQAPIGIFYYDTDLIIVDANRAMANTLRVEKQQLIGLDLHNIPDQRPLQGAYRDGDFTKPGVYEGPYHSQIRGLDLWIKVEFMPLVDEGGKMIGGMAMLADNTNEHEALEQAEFLSLHDPLTMMPNRKLLKERIRQLLKEEKRQDRLSALLFLDLDHFKHINDSAGHLVGDRLLIETARRLEILLRESDTLSRLGGDEFVILLPMISTDEDETVRHAFHVAEKIHTSLKQPFSIDNHLYYTSCSIGVATLDSTLLDVDELLRRADTAMYQAKEEGRDRTHFYDPAMDQKAREYLYIQRQLRHALEDERFALYFQPIVRISDNTIIAAESLLRWRDSTGREISPALFIPVAEESGLIKEIGRWVINGVCKQIDIWNRQQSYAFEYISINISPRQLLEEGIGEYIIQTIERHGISPSNIRLEITETALIENFEKTKGLIEQMNAQGIKFIIDDFGTGYSSLSYLKQLSFSAMKIDKSFVRDILNDPKDAALVRSIIDIARQFDYQVIAEGVEDEAQRTWLSKADDALYFQGYLCSRAMGSAEFEAYLAERPCGPA